MIDAAIIVGAVGLSITWCYVGYQWGVRSERKRQAARDAAVVARRLETRRKNRDPVAAATVTGGWPYDIEGTRTKFDPGDERTEARP